MLPVQLTERIEFPPTAHASGSRPLAVGGDLRTERLLAAYRQGIFPWPVPGYPLAWWSPDPRFVLYPSDLRVSQSLSRVVRKGKFVITADRCFGEVIRHCRRAVRPGQFGTWITPAMEAAYCALHRSGYAHSVEAWVDGTLVGGLYGVGLGACFFGESMFATVPDASKVAFVHLMGAFLRQGVRLVDCQVHTDHLERFGARLVPRSRFLSELAEALGDEASGFDWARL